MVVNYSVNNRDRRGRKMSPADAARVKRKEETRAQEVRTGKGGDPRSQGK